MAFIAPVASLLASFAGDFPAFLGATLAQSGSALGGLAASAIHGGGSQRVTLFGRKIAETQQKALELSGTSAFYPSENVVPDLNALTPTMMGYTTPFEFMDKTQRTNALAPYQTAYDQELTKFYQSAGTKPTDATGRIIAPSIMTAEERLRKDQPNLFVQQDANQLLLKNAQSTLGQQLMRAVAGILTPNLQQGVSVAEQDLFLSGNVNMVDSITVGENTKPLQQIQSTDATVIGKQNTTNINAVDPEIQNILNKITQQATDLAAYQTAQQNQILKQQQDFSNLMYNQVARSRKRSLGLGGTI